MTTKTAQTLENYKVGSTQRYYDGMTLKESKVREVKVTGNTFRVGLENNFVIYVDCN